MNWHEKIKMIRKKLGLTQIAMAEALGVKQSCISQYESGHAYPYSHSRKKYIELARQVKIPLRLEELLRE